MNFEPVVNVEPVTKATVDMIARSLGTSQSVILRLKDVDINAGSGIINKTKKCLWTKDGRRISFEISDGGFIGDISKEADPAKPC